MGSKGEKDARKIKNCGKIETSSDPRTPNGIQHVCMLKIKLNEGYLQLCSNVFTANTNTSTRHKWGNKKINGGNEEHRDGGGEGEGEGRSFCTRK